MRFDAHVKTWYGLIATVGGAGTFSKMPGTIGTLVAFLILLVLGRVSPVLLLVTILIGTLAADKYAKTTKKEDPSEVVVDEVAGYWVSVYGFDASYALIAFFMFRIIDILKPFPVRNMEKLPGGVGIMADDICGGIIVNILLRLLSWLFAANGLETIYRFLGVGQ